MTDSQFSDYLKANSQLSERTVKAYNNQFSKFDGMSKNVVTQSQANIISYIDGLEASENTKLAVLNVAINMRKHYKKEVNKLNTRKLQLTDDYQVQKNEKKAENKTDLPTSKELIAWENRQYIDGNWTGYIITYLMRVLSLRNKDLDLKIIPANRSLRKVGKDDKNNYLILRKNSSQVVRSDYKTFKQYGTLKNVIQSRKINRAIRELIAERDLELGKDTINLLSTKAGAKMNEESIAKKIRSYTFRGMSESEYNKVFVSEVAEVKDLKKLEKISKNRGTSLEVLLKEYHLDV
jgi:hypothetical protein